MTYPEMALRLESLNASVQAAEDNLKDIKYERDKFVDEMSAQMIEDGMESFVFDGKSYSVTQSIKWASVKGGSKEELYEVLRKHGHGDIITETINANTLRSSVSEWVEENGGVLPEYLEGLITHDTETKISVRRK